MRRLYEGVGRPVRRGFDLELGMVAGEMFAMHEGVTILSMLVRRYNFELDPDVPLEMTSVCGPTLFFPNSYPCRTFRLRMLQSVHFAHFSEMGPGSVMLFCRA